MSPFVRLAIVRLGDRICAQSVLLIVLGLMTLSYSGLPDSRIAELDFQTTRSLARLHAGDLEGTPEAERLVLNEDLLWQPNPGQFRSTRPLGGPIASIPFYWLGALFQSGLDELEAKHALSAPSRLSEYAPHMAVGWKNSVLTAFLAWLVVLSARRIGVGRKHAWFSGLVFVLSSFVWPQARGSSIEIQVAFFLFLAFHLLLRARERFERLRRPRRLDLVFIGFSLGMTFLTRPGIWPAILILAVAAVIAVFSGYRVLAKHALFLRQTWRIGHWVDTLWILLPLLVAIALTAVGNQARSGSFFGLPGELSPQLSMRSFSDLALSLISPGRGLIWLAPLVLLAPFGIAFGLNRGEKLWPLCVILVGLPILWAAQTPLGADLPWGFGPGRLLAALPFLWLGVAYALDRLSRKVWHRRACHALCAFGLLSSFSGVLVDTGTYQSLIGKLANSELAELTEPESDYGERYRTVHWDLGLAEPWASWRILRHRLAVEGENFPAAQIFMLEESADEDVSVAIGPTLISPETNRNLGFQHMAWIDLNDRLETSPYPGMLFSILLVGLGCIFAIRGLDRALP
ncbi:MAG: hypothetical protein ACI8TQ_001539 [Planctomycetota bacterium]